AFSAGFWSQPSVSMTPPLSRHAMLESSYPAASHLSINSASSSSLMARIRSALVIAITILYPHKNSRRPWYCLLSWPPKMQTIRVLIHIITLGRMVLHNSFFCTKEHIFDHAHFVPCR